MEQCCTYLDFIICLVAKLHTNVATVFLFVFYLFLYMTVALFYLPCCCLLKKKNKFNNKI